MSNSTEPVSNVWHDRSELPDSNKTVLIIEKASYIGNPGTPHLSKYDTRNKCYIAVEETDIDNHPQIYNISHIEKWAYVDYLLGLSNSVAKTSEQKEPKFKIGQTITGPEDKTFTFHINRIEDGKYIESDDIWVLIKDADEEYQLVEVNKMCMYSKDNFTDEDRKVLCEGCEEECEYAKKEKYFDPISLVHKWDNEFDELLEPYKDSRNYKNLYIKLRWWKQNCEREFLWKWKYKKEGHVSKDRFAFKAIPRLLEMLEPNDRAKAYTNRLADALEKEGYNTDAKIVREKIRVMNGETVTMATMDEEPVSDGLEEEVYEHLWKGRMGTDVSRPIYLSYDELVAVARHFTNWQKGQMIKEAVKGEVGEYYPTTIHLDKDIPELKHFDKVKMIIIMED